MPPQPQSGLSPRGQPGLPPHFQPPMQPRPQQPLSSGPQQPLPPRPQAGWNNGYYPPKRNRTGLVGCGVTGLVVIALVIGMAIVFGSKVLGPTPATPSPMTSASATPRASVTPTPARPSSAPASRTPARSTPQAAGTSRAHPQGQYVNDDYRLPPEDGRNNLPRPNDFNSARNWTDNNYLYGQLMPAPVRCELDVLDWSNASNEQRHAHMVSFRECLMRAWDPAVRAAGSTLTTPLVELTEDNAQTPCGSTHTYGGYYCSQNQTIYMNVSRHRTINTANGSILPYFEVTFAHEFGHHVQACTGIMWASWYIRDQLGHGEEWNLESRKTELQAQCFSGLVMNSLSQSMGLTENDRKEMIKFEYGRNSDDQHGTKENYGLWWEHGFGQQKVSECNSFNARNPATLQ